MTDSMLLEFLDNVYTPHRDHCVVCLRTRDDRRLEQPTYLKKFLTSINQPFTFTLPNQLVCYICERQAAAAFRFRLATNVGAQAHVVVKEIKRAPVKRAYFLDRLNGTKSTMNRNAAKLKVASTMMDCESRLRELRTRTQLRQTEVLVVCTSNTKDPDNSKLIEVNENPEYFMEQFSSRPGESCDLYVVPDDAPNSREANVSDSFELIDEPKMELESIFICDDDDPIGIDNEASEPFSTDTNTLSIDPKLLRINTNILRIDSEKKKTDKSTRPVPIVNFLNEPAAGEMPQLNEKAILEQSAATPSNFLLHPIIFNSGMMTVPSLSGNIINGKLVTSKDTKFIINTPQIALQNGENMDIIVDPGKVTNVLKMLSHQNVAKVHVFTTAAPQITTVETQSNNAVNENIDQNNTSDHSYSTFTNNNRYNTRYNGRRGRKTCNEKSMKKIRDSTKYFCETGVYQDVSKSFKMTERTDTLTDVSTGIQICLVGGSRSLAESLPMGECRLLDESSFVGESRLLGESSFVGESRTRGESELGRNKEAQSAQLSTDRIDWEDKIPMDVISFMDADENSSKRARHTADWLPPPLGIYNVTSLSQETTEDVIDLC